MKLRHRIYLTALSLLCFYYQHQVTVFADSKGNFPGKGEVEEYNRACEFSAKAAKFAKDGDLENAAKMERKAILTYPFDSASRHNEAVYLRKSGRYIDARNAEQRALELEPNFVAALIGKGLCYERLGKYTDAEEVFKKAAELEPNNFEAVGDLGDVLRQQEKFTEAKTCFNKAKKLTSNETFLKNIDKLIELCDSKDSSSD